MRSALAHVLSASLAFGVLVVACGDDDVARRDGGAAGDGGTRDAGGSGAGTGGTGGEQDAGGGGGKQDAGGQHDAGGKRDAGGADDAGSLDAGGGDAGGAMTDAGDGGDAALAVCGDGVIAGAEECDDDDGDDDDGCDSACVVEDGFDCTGTPSVCVTTCGDGIVAGSEECDDMDTDGDDGCSSTCVVEMGYDCTGMPSTCATVCGDDFIVAGVEDCESAIALGTTCIGLGYEGGDLACGGDCLYDLAECSICGDGIQQGPEDCDGIDFGSETCASQGFSGGNLGCALATCTFSYVGCTGGAYSQDFEAGVLPPEFGVGGNLGFVVDGNLPIAGSYSAHSGAITHGQTSTLGMTVVFTAAGTVGFSYKVSSEACCDFLRFYIDGVQQQQWSGTSMGSASIPIAAGMHSLEWRYVKDGSINTASDRAWIDDVVLAGGIPQ